MGCKHDVGPYEMPGAVEAVAMALAKVVEEEGMVAFDFTCGTLFHGNETARVSYEVGEAAWVERERGEWHEFEFGEEDGDE